MEKNQKRQDILQAAMALFMDKGFQNTKMEDIAIDAGVGKGTLYEYFENKQDIFDEACIEYVNVIIDNIRYVSNMDDTFNNKLLILFNGKLKMESDFEDMSIDNILSSKNIISEETIKKIILKISEMYGLICDIIDQGKEEGVVKKSIKSEITACMIMGTMGEYLRLISHKKENEIKDDDVIFDLLYNGFAVKKHQ
ncbi:MAG TPA: TetR/AcrR family transcriptional regulator [Sedimentibacter sp.]|nr:TetR/AcrR family transcriptional regulator [Sedimentibacter sp.]HNZ82689.1 TetR/AcrR family transcriptional regulator [Sedimentibacter sp.]HOH70312.1 TetR/AcrR family transcriptional regulator [Sedimentibacter sp.]